MPTSSRFAIAVHVMTLMARFPGRPVKSDQLAESVKTNPVVIRRLLCGLGQAGLVASQTGVGGGSWLARAAGQITLWQIYCAVEPGPLFALHRQQPNQECIVGRHIEEVLSDVLQEAENSLFRVLERITLDEVARAVGPCGMPAVSAFDVIL